MNGNRRGFSFHRVTIVVAIVAAFAFTALRLVRSHVTANENLARQSLYDYNSALFAYWTIYETYPMSLANLGAGPQVGVASAGLIDPDLASGRKGGYVFTYVPGELDFDGTTSMFKITATPRVSSVTGRRTFSIDETGVVHELATAVTRSASQ
jgi:hypothetical protein